MPRTEVIYYDMMKSKDDNDEMMKSISILFISS